MRCLVDPENPEMALVDPGNSEFHIIHCPGPRNLLFRDIT